MYQAWKFMKSQALLKTRVIFNKCQKNQIPETSLHGICNYFQDICYTFDHFHELHNRKTGN